MGKFIWSQWGRLMALTSGYWTLWGGLWGIFYRKFIWDFIGGKLGPVGIVPGPGSALFIDFIVKIPVIQLVCIAFGILTILIEWPLFPSSFLYRSLIFKATLYIHAALASALIYQSLDAALFYLISALAYVIGSFKKEKVGERDTDDAKV
ncbi:hypothetical protein O181_037226 [Austropuccinia psidii MF-1]|uniref:DUF7727 domain-containing protein n=1 Tax=Austropuccinia psidii MF-1 TaxID=1389203 RepID=A0A9Q3DBP1_9BASI|nr:hypothetical protein [Austropuccinia psidii MF-1]